MSATSSHSGREAVSSLPQTHRSAGPGSAAGAALRFAAPDLTHRRRLRRHLARCRSGAVFAALFLAGAIAADRPSAAVFAAMLTFLLLREAAETRAEL